MKLPSKLLLFALSSLGLFLLTEHAKIPTYFFFAALFLIIPSMFFIFRAEKLLDEKRFVLVIILSLIGGFIWDSIAIKLNIWGFPLNSVTTWILGIPLEEYIFFITFPTIALGIYSSLPKHRKKHLFNKEYKINDSLLLMIVFSLQIGLFVSILYFGMQSYLKWLLFFCGIPSTFYLFRKGERIDEINLIITVGIFILYSIFVDPFFILSRAWYYAEPSLIGRIWVIPVDDLLFTTFCTIIAVGFYTSIPRKLFSSQE